MMEQTKIQKLRDEEMRIYKRGLITLTTESEWKRIYEIAEEIRQLELAESIYPVACPSCDNVEQDPMERRDEIGL